MTCRWEKIGNPLGDGILHPAGGATEFSFEDLLLRLIVNLEREIALADRAAENSHQ